MNDERTDKKSHMASLIRYFRYNVSQYTHDSWETTERSLLSLKSFPSLKFVNNTNSNLLIILWRSEGWVRSFALNKAFKFYSANNSMLKMKKNKNWKKKSS